MFYDSWIMHKKTRKKINSGRHNTKELSNQYLCGSFVLPPRPSSPTPHSPSSAPESHSGPRPTGPRNLEVRYQSLVPSQEQTRHTDRTPEPATGSSAKSYP